MGRDLKETGELIGQCGLTMRRPAKERCWRSVIYSERISGTADTRWRPLPRAGIMHLKLGAEEVYSIIRDTNAPSRPWRRNGMTVCGSIVKHYYGMDMPHLL